MGTCVHRQHTPHVSHSCWRLPRLHCPSDSQHACLYEAKDCDRLQKWPGVVPVVVARCDVCKWVCKGSRTFAALCMHAPDAGMWFLTRASGLVGRYRSSLQQASQPARQHTHTVSALLGAPATRHALLLSGGAQQEQLKRCVPGWRKPCQSLLQLDPAFVLAELIEVA